MRMNDTGWCAVFLPSSTSADISVHVVIANAGRMQVVKTPLVTPTITRESFNLRTFDDIKVVLVTKFGMLMVGTRRTVNCRIFALSNLIDIKLITIMASQGA